MAATKRAAPPTHVTVWVGLAMAAVGLLVALYAYTGTRVYDVTFAFVAVLGGLLALAGILTSAWGRAVMAARAGRARRLTMQQDAMKLGKEVAVVERPPTVAEPASKKKFDFSATARRMMPERPSFLTRKSAPPPAPAEAAPLAAAAAVLERVTLKCPQCASEFSAEGVRPFAATCPHCGFSADV